MEDKERGKEREETHANDDSHNPRKCVGGRSSVGRLAALGRGPGDAAETRAAHGPGGRRWRRGALSSLSLSRHFNYFNALIASDER
jgi:hypothetical protein